MTIRHFLSRALARLGLRSPRKYHVSSKAIVKAPNLVIGLGSEIGDYVVIQSPTGQVQIGQYSQINYFSVIFGGDIYIGDNVMIAPHVMIAAGNHDYLQTQKPIRFADNLSKKPIRIEDNVWIGANCTITDGVTIGRDAVVGANSVVTHDVQPYDIVAGVPARLIRNRKQPQRT